MKRLFTLTAVALFAVGCNNANHSGMDSRNNDSDIQRMETPATDSDATSTSSDIQREEEVRSDVDMSEDGTSGAGPTGSDIGTNRGAGSAAGSSDAAGMGMDE